jgi:thioesterase domain-containing protein
VKSSTSDSIRFLESLRSQGVLVRAKQGKLVCNAPKGALTPELRQQLALRKADILDLLDTPSYSVVEIQPRGSRPALFGVHSTRYRTLSAHLGSDQPLYALRYGLAQASVPPPLPESLEELASHYVEEMRRVQPEGPYYLMGLCIGGLIAYEMAQLLLAQDEQVALLALFDAVAPGGRTALPLRNRVRNLLRIGVGDALQRARDRLRSRVRQIGDDERDNVAQDRYRAYAPRRSYAGDVEFFRPADRVSLTHRFAHDLGWGALIEGRLAIHEIPGQDHTAMFEEPQVARVAEELAACLEAAGARTAATARELRVGAG